MSAVREGVVTATALALLALSACLLLWAAGLYLDARGFLRRAQAERRESEALCLRAEAHARHSQDLLEEATGRLARAATLAIYGRGQAAKGGGDRPA